MTKIYNLIRLKSSVECFSYMKQINTDNMDNTLFERVNETHDFALLEIVNGKTTNMWTAKDRNQMKQIIETQVKHSDLFDLTGVIHYLITPTKDVILI